MRSILFARPASSAAAVFALLAAGFAMTVAAQETAPQDSAFVKLLKGGKVPEDRQGTIVEMIGKRGSTDDLAYIYQQAIKAEGFAPAVQRKALAALQEAALTRKARPSGDLAGLRDLIRADAAKAEPATRQAAIRLAALWNEPALAEALRAVAEADATDDKTRAASLDAFATVGGDQAKAAIAALAKGAKSVNTRALAVAALAKLDPDAAAEQAAGILRDAGPKTDLQPLLAAFLSRQDGVDKLVAAIDKASPSADAAKLALRATYALGRADAPLVAALSKAAGLDAEVKPLQPAEMEALIAEVQSKGDPRRGEDVFRRVELNCVKCHALGGAGGGVGPDLSALGGSSPVDYIVNAILLPDQAIKEQYNTLIVLTTDGQIFQGIVADKDDKRIVLKEATGETRTVATDAIDDSKEGGSLMPKGLSNLMTHAEFVDLLRFISELGKPGPYGVPTTPVVMRWQALKGAPELLAASVPEPAAVRAEILDGDAARWQTTLARVGGRIPLREISELVGGTVVYLKGEIDVSTAGAITVRFDSRDGVAAWIDDRPIGPDGTVEVETGRHPLIVRIDTARTKAGELRVEVARPEGSSAEFVVVGGP